MLKRIFTMFLAGAISFSLLTGCAKESSEPSTTESTVKNTSEDTVSGEYPEELSLPLTDEPVTLSMFVHTRVGVDDFENNEFTKWLEEQTGIDLEFVVSPEQSVEEKRNVLLTSGDYPDIFTGTTTMKSAQIKMYGDMGVFITLNDLIDKYGYNTKKALEAFPQASDIITMPNGNIYALPSINDAYHAQMSYKMWVYQPWLDALELDMPATTEEFKDMLMDFKEKDPNGNGIADEIPMMGSLNGWNSSPELFLMNSFVYWDIRNAKGLHVQDGKIIASYTQDGWKEGLKYLHSLVEEGLLAPETYTQDNDVLIQHVDNDPILVGAAPSGYMGMFTQVAASDKWADFVAMPPVKGPDGTQYVTWNPYDGVSLQYMITDKCENPELAFKLADFLYTEEATQRQTGPEGIAYRNLESDSGLLGMNGKPATYEMLQGIDQMPQNSGWNQTTVSLRTADFRASAALADSALFEAPLHQMTEKNYAPYKPSIEMVIPPIIFGEESAVELLTIENTVSTYIEEKTVAFITGALDIDANWEIYLTELETMGLPRLIELYQEALDEYNAKG